MSIVILCLAPLSRALFSSNNASLGLPPMSAAPSLDTGALIPLNDIIIEIREYPIDPVLYPLPYLGGFATTWPPIRW